MDIFNDILVFKSERSNNKSVEIGGTWMQPSLGTSYLLAAHYVLKTSQKYQRVDDVALPLLFLQRHSYELALKKLLGLVCGIKNAGERFFSLEENGGVINAHKQVTMHSTHCLKTLFRELKRALAVIGDFEIPSEMEFMTEILSTLELDKPDRFRYLESLKGERYFPREVELPVGDIQLKLEKIFSEILSVNPESGNSLMTVLSEEYEAWEQMIMKTYPDYAI